MNDEALTSRIRQALDATPDATPDIEPERIAAILGGTRVPTALDFALIADAAGVNVEWLLTGDPLGAVKVILGVAQDPNTWLLDGAHDVSFGRHAAMAKALAGILERHVSEGPIRSYTPCAYHRYETPEIIRGCSNCRRLPDYITCAYCGVDWPCEDVRAIAASIDPGAFDVPQVTA